MKFRSQVYTAVSGSIGGLTYSHNRGGMYTRGRATPTNPNTIPQQLARIAAQASSAAWRDTLSHAQRMGWTEYALNTPITDAFGEPLTLTGQQMYVRCNAPRIRAGLGMIALAPINPGQAELGTVTATWSSPEIEINYDNTKDWAGAVGGALLIQTAKIVAGTINYYNAPFCYQTRVNGAGTPPTSPLALSENYMGLDYNDYEGEGLRTFFRVRATQADGRLSPVAILSADLT